MKNILKGYMYSETCP